MMKKLLFLFGTFSLMLLSLSYMFSVMEWEGSVLLRVFGFLILTLVMIAGAVKMRSIIMYSGAISLVIILFSLGLRNIEFPGAKYLLSAGMLIFSVLFLPMAAFWAYRQSGIRNDPGRAGEQGYGANKEEKEPDPSS